jgi:hypothetical protein
VPQTKNGFETVAAERVFEIDAEVIVAARTNAMNESLVIFKRTKLARNDVFLVEMYLVEFLPTINAHRHDCAQPISKIVALVILSLLDEATRNRAALERFAPRRRERQRLGCLARHPRSTFTD